MIAQVIPSREDRRDATVLLRRPDRRLKLAALLAEFARPDLAAEAYWQLDHPARAEHLRQAERVIEWIGKELGDGD